MAKIGAVMPTLKLEVEEEMLQGGNIYECRWCGDKWQIELDAENDFKKYRDHCATHRQEIMDEIRE